MKPRFMRRVIVGFFGAVWLILTPLAITLSQAPAACVNSNETWYTLNLAFTFLLCFAQGDPSLRHSELHH